MKIRKLIILLAFGCVNGCIVNDIPYPIIVGEITEIQVEGQDGAAVIDSENFIVNIKLADDVAVDPINVRLLKFEVSNQATVSPVPAEYIDLSTPLEYTLTTYQDYLWTIKGEQIIERYVDVENQAESALIDPINKIVKINVVPSQSFSNIKIIRVKLGPAGAIISPNPKDVHDFSVVRSFEVSYRDIKETWIIEVVSEPVLNETKADPWATKVFLSGTYAPGQGEPGFEYKKTSDRQWIVVSQSEIVGNDFSVEIKGLLPGTEYSYHSVIGETIGEDKTFTTEQDAQMINSSFDDWFKDGKTWYADADLTPINYFWDSGNKGTNTLGEKNPTSPESVHVVSGKAVKMASTSVFGIFAAGNIYSGQYGKTIGFGAEVYFGRPFITRPTQVKFHYDYKSGIIDKVSEDYTSLRGTQDSCHVFVMLTDWDTPFTINTTTGKFLDFKDEDIIAFGELKTDQSTSEYNEFIIDLKYRREGVSPTHILFVATASKYGDYFTGSTSSVLYLDEVRLVY